jgi:hypothetical protein
MNIVGIHKISEREPVRTVICQHVTVNVNAGVITMHAMKVYVVEAFVHPFLTFVLEGVNGQLHTLPLGVCLWYPLNVRVIGS